MRQRVISLLMAFVALPLAVAQGATRILVNHVGYEAKGPKHAVVLANPGDDVRSCALKDYPGGNVILNLPAKAQGPVKKWKDWNFWTIDFDSITSEGDYFLECSSKSEVARSLPFAIQRFILQRNTLSNAIYYFKQQRSSGAMDLADRNLHFDGKKGGTLDAHGGWWDATGDYGKHLSHLSFSTYFNPQQIPLAVYSLLKSYELLDQKGVPEFARYRDRLLDEAIFGADYLVRIRVPSGSFYRSVTTGGVKQVPEERKIAGEMKKFGIYQSSDQTLRDMVEQANSDLEYEVSYRSGGGLAIAALAMASRYPSSGDYKSADYLKAAEDAFDFLEANNLKLLNDGRENILDDYCALTAATELFKATKKDRYKNTADLRAKNLTARLISSGPYSDYWRADDRDRPFFHASDAGFPAVALLYYAEIADGKTREQVVETVKKSLVSQIGLTNQVTNPFGYARQIVQDKTGNRRTSFFFPHNTEAAPWWQGENARLASLAAAARLASRQIQDPEFTKVAEAFATNQLNWILGLNPYDASMMYGVGHNNPQYMFFDSWEFTNAPGGISNGITSGFQDEDDIDFNLTYKKTGADNDWRWQEQWLPHASWYLLAVSADEDRK